LHDASGDIHDSQLLADSLSCRPSQKAAIRAAAKLAATSIRRKAHGAKEEHGSSTAFHQNVDEMKSMDSFARLGENHSDASWHRADLQRRMADEDAISCQCLGETQY
jgi:hypothetical protein